MSAIFAVNVLNNLFATLMLEVHINIGRFSPCAADEARKQGMAAGRINFSNAQAVAHGRVGGRASALAQNPLTARVTDDVMQSQKVGLVLKVCNQAEFLFQARAQAVANPFGVALLRATLGFLSQILNATETGRDNLDRVLVLDFT